MPPYALNQLFPGRSPQLLLDFVAWFDASDPAADRMYRIRPTRLSDSWIENGADLAPHFALFLTLGDGSTIGYWFPEGSAGVDAPMVLLGSEGQKEVLADHLEGLLARLALGDFPDDGPLSGLLLDGERQPDSALTTWLTARLGTTDLVGLTRVTTPWSLQGMLDAWQDAQVETNRANPLLQQIAARLAAYVPPASEPWLTANFKVALVGDHFEAWHLRAGPQPFPEAAALKPLLQAVRAERAEAFPARGAWFSATIRLSGDGKVTVMGQFDEPPQFLGEAPRPEDYAAEMRAFPRSKAWTPGWLATLLDSQ
ncbi:hypothetical protein HLB42_18450 (plasmid) [Deinococcus sp. D7000]|nr:hypothetical protein HLB42_18450 [Deinococcus sp. D7000]